jgi:hypothetical protein
MARWGGFRKGRRRYTKDWDALKAPSAEREESVADTPQEFSYVEAKGIWNLNSTMQFPKSNRYMPTTLEFVASRTTTDDILAVPTQAAVGDIAVVYASEHNPGVRSGNTLPSGWVTVREDFDSADSVMISGYKILQAGDLVTSFRAIDGSDYNAMLVFRPSRPVSSLTTFSVNGQATISNPSAQTINMGLAPTDSTILAVAFMSGTTTLFPSTSPAMTRVSVASQSSAFYTVFNGSPTNITVDMPDEGDNAMQSWGLAIS